VDVKVGEVTLKIRGLTARDLLGLMTRFEPVRKMLEGGREEGARTIAGSKAPQTLIATLSEAVMSALATCTGTTPERREEDEKIASELAFGDQVAIINAIFQATFREGTGPFMIMLNQLTQIMRPMQAQTIAEPVQASPSRNVSPPRS